MCSLSSRTISFSLECIVMLCVEALYGASLSSFTVLSGFFPLHGPDTLVAARVQSVHCLLCPTFLICCPIMSNGLKTCATLGWKTSFFVGDSHLDCIDCRICEKTGVQASADGTPCMFYGQSRNSSFLPSPSRPPPPCEMRFSVYFIEILKYTDT